MNQDKQYGNLAYNIGRNILPSDDEIDGLYTAFLTLFHNRLQQDFDMFDADVEGVTPAYKMDLFLRRAIPKITNRILSQSSNRFLYALIEAYTELKESGFYRNPLVHLMKNVYPPLCSMYAETGEDTDFSPVECIERIAEYDAVNLFESYLHEQQRGETVEMTVVKAKKRKKK